jgi:hypothetical protein
MASRIGHERLSVSMPGYKYLYGKSLPQTPGDVASFGVDFFQNEKSKESEVYLEKSLGREGKHARWKIIDAILVPKLKKGETISMECKPDDVEPFTWDQGYPRNFMFAIARFSSGEVQTKRVRSIWRVDWTKNQFESLSDSGVTCFNNEAED